MATNQISCFSDNGEYLAQSGFDGTLRIFESATGILKQEYCSSSHLSATTSALTWSRQRRDMIMSPKAKKRKVNNNPEKAAYQDDLNLIALGTTSGTVNLYSFAKGQLHAQLTGGHTSKVNDACWHLTEAELFTCSDDQYVIQWDLRNAKVKQKWKCDTSGVHSVCQCSESRLLTASHGIKLWDLNTRTILQNFTGHSSPVFRLCPVWLPTEDNSHNGCYFLSAAVDDRHISVWSINSTAKDGNSVASFSVPDEPLSLSLSRPSAASQALLLAVITRKGAVLLFEQVLNGKRKKPLLCKTTVKAERCQNGETDKEAVPIFASCVSGSRVTLAIGNPVTPQFETVVYDPSKSELTVSVQVLQRSLKKEEQSNVRRMVVSEHASTLTPADLLPTTATKSKDKKRIRRSSVSDMTVEERLNAMSTDTQGESNSKSSKKQPVATTLSRLLQQGLLSEDKKILTGVFQEKDDRVVRNTVKQLPVSCILPLLKYIEKGMNGHAQHACLMSSWTAALIGCHTSYILSVPEVITSLNRLYHTLVNRQKFYPKMLQLKGRLDLVKHENQSQEPEEEDHISQPLLVHQDESDSEDSDSMVIDGAALESDEGWDDISDME